MFWGLVLESGKRYAQTVDKAFHISMASLDTLHSENELISVNVNYKNAEFIVCNLQKHKVIQTQLDLNFMAGDKIALFTTGKGRVHLTGYLIDEKMIDEFGSDTDSSVEEIVEDASQIKQGKRKNATPEKKSGKKQKVENANEVADSDEDEESDMDATEESGEEEMDSDEGEEEEEEEDDDEDDDSDESEDEVPQIQQQLGKKDKQQKSEKFQQGKQPNTPNEMKKDKVQGVATPKMQNTQLNGTPDMQSGKKNKKKGGETPGDKGPQTPKTPANQTPGQTPQKKILQGGVAIEDTQVGTGQVAKPGKNVTVYYCGRLKQNNKKFDETSQGPGFKFRLGKGEVIKGWDIGLTGMKVGGKRKLTIPANMAYGAKGSPPVIPPNSALVFEVELKAVH